MKRNAIDSLYASGVGPSPIFTALGDHYLRRDSAEDRVPWRPLAGNARTHLRRSPAKAEAIPAPHRGRRASPTQSREG